MSAVPTTPNPLPRQQRRLTETEATRAISRVVAAHRIAEQSDFELLLEQIISNSLCVPGVAAVRVTLDGTLGAVLPTQRIFGESHGRGARGSAFSDILVAGQKLGQVELYFELQPSALASPLRFARFIAQQIGMAAERASLAIRRAELRVELNELQASIASRKAINRAKALLMHAHMLNEDEAFVLLRRYSENTGRTLHQVADAIIVSERHKEDPIRLPVRPNLKRWGVSGR
jgi:hypothetical protein